MGVADTQCLQLVCAVQVGLERLSTLTTVIVGSIRAEAMEHSSDMYRIMKNCSVCKTKCS